ncbi:MAG: low molecular weight phosphotyrosine protein phosphatase [Prevotellaceae bacterium]|nr:low molecular weight phosphotyrosine protein phosphatase [Candidatus Colivivens caballi]
MTRILFICHGNICRSPMAEMIMKKLVADCCREHQFVIDSAAVSTEELGNPIYPPAKRIMRQHGIPFTDHRARQVTRLDYGNYDLLVCMDTSNLRWLRRFIPDGDPEGKVRLLMEFTGVYRDVADPWYTDDFETAYRDILSGCEALLKVTQ